MNVNPKDTHAVYERQATEFDKRRSKALFEARWLARFTASLKPGDHVLDLGCGSGDPIARWFMAEGFAVTGVDFSEAMLAIARERWPDGDWRHADMREFELEQQFDGIIAWDSFFHLTADEQKNCIARMAHHLRPGGMLMLTVGPRAGEVSGTVGEELVYHASLSPADYAICLEENELRMTGFLAEDPETQSRTVLMACKI
ncbi:class I SAM-dependent methyltransferase [Ruegeria arenilitoris]|uniref:class I SAM-dependent methyltransferase n=1 Tax=Ruegeria arenilitoris TaxID=1173585 RepID=UPI001479B28F|nr:class I SAM-dependent methyltransferase [Ruegeria arenilitoris]